MTNFEKYKAKLSVEDLAFLIDNAAFGTSCNDVCPIAKTAKENCPDICRKRLIKYFESEVKSDD